MQAGNSPLAIQEPEPGKHLVCQEMQKKWKEIQAEPGALTNKQCLGRLYECFEQHGLSTHILQILNMLLVFILDRVNLLLPFAKLG